MIADLNPVLRGWGNYFRTGNAANKFNQLDATSCGGSTLPGQEAGPQPARRAGRRWTEDCFDEHGLHRLRGTVRYPEAA